MNKIYDNITPKTSIGKVVVYYFGTMLSVTTAISLGSILGAAMFRR